MGRYRVSRGGCFSCQQTSPTSPFNFAPAVPDAAKTTSGVLPTAPGPGGRRKVGGHLTAPLGSPALRPPSSGGALARCIVGVVVWLEPVCDYKSRDSAPLPLLVRSPVRGLIWASLARGTLVRRVSGLFPGYQRRKPEGHGEELCARGERSPYVLVRLATAAREPGVPAAASVERGGGGGSPRRRQQRNGGDGGGHPAADHQAAESE